MLALKLVLLYALFNHNLGCRFMLDFSLIRCNIDGKVEKNGLRLANYLHLLDNTTRIPTWVNAMPKLDQIHIRSNFIDCCVPNISGIRIVLQKCSPCKGNIQI